MSTFTVIAITSLETVTGGNASEAPNTTQQSGNLGVTIPTKLGPLQVGVQGSQSTASTNYAECVRAVRSTGGTPADIRAACGLPGGAQ